MATAWNKLVSCCMMFIDKCNGVLKEVPWRSYIAIWCVRQPTRLVGRDRRWLASDVWTKWRGWSSTTARRRYEWTRSIGLLFVASVVVALLALEPSGPELLAGCSSYRNGGVTFWISMQTTQSCFRKCLLSLRQNCGVVSAAYWPRARRWRYSCSVAIPSTLLRKIVYRQCCSVPYCRSNGELPSPVKAICQLSFATLRSCSRYSVVAARQRYTCFRNIHRFSQCRRRRKGQKTLGAARAVLPRLPDGLFTPAPTNGK